MENLTRDLQVLGRLCDRLRAMSEGALVRPRDELDRQSVAESVHRLCARAAREQGTQTPVPVLNPLASGDQLAVIGREFLEWVATSGDQTAIERWRAEVERIRAAA